jgi:hypothetical protein
MSDFGVGTWDELSVPNNYGIKPVSVIQTIHLNAGQNSGTYTFQNIPTGMKVGFALTLESGNEVTIGRRIIASGNIITISSASTTGQENYPANEVDMIVFVENQ